MKEQEVKKVPLIVTMSGKLDVVVDAGMTAENVFDLIDDRYGIDTSKMKEPFVVVHDQLLQSYRIIEGMETVGGIDGLREVIRVVLPLKEL